jgi:hypothetical protein
MQRSCAMWTSPVNESAELTQGAFLLIHYSELQAATPATLVESNISKNQGQILKAKNLLLTVNWKNLYLSKIRNRNLNYRITKGVRILP